ncbi:MAG: hypothetical protein ACOC8F_06485 [Planctomycetota bacterium]
MAKKMYYSEAEAAEQLGGEDKLNELVDNGELRAYPDGDKRMFKADDVDALGGGSDETGEIKLSPADTSAPADETGQQPGDQASLSEADTEGEKPASKEDTVITSEGISIFDEEDLDIETADPMAKTQVAPSVEDQVLLEGTGSGSGLLDLTRESDDTSLGAEVLEHIDMEGSVGGEEEAPAGAQPAYPAQAQAAMAAPTYVEAVDATSGLFTGMALGCVVVAILGMVVTIAAMAGTVPPFVAALREKTMIVIVAGVVLTGIFALLGWLLGKSVAARQEATRRVGG